MAQLSRARDRSMHSIVATIQAEQDRAIRAPAKGVVAISGGPGTGKTVVALHRAAYLLYTDRRRYEAGGVLVVGPSGVFMRYIERVLPSLGETAVALRSLGEVVGGLRATRHDAPDVAGVKGSAHMAELMRRTARQQAPGSAKEFRVFWRDDVIHLDRGILGKLRRQLMAQGQRNRQLPRIASSLLDVMWRQVRGERGRERGRDAFDDDMLSCRRSSTSRCRGGRRWAPPRCSAGCVTRSSWPASARGSSRPRSSSCWCGRGRPTTCPSRTSPWSTSCATPSATFPTAPRRRTTSSTTTSAATSRSSRPRPSGSTGGRGAVEAAHPPDRGRPLRPCPGRRGAGPHADAMADGRTPWSQRDLDDRR